MGLTGRLLAAWALVRRIRLTVALFLAILIAGALTATLARGSWPAIMDRFGWDLNALRHGRLYALWAGLLFASTPGEHVSLLGILLLGLGTMEYRRGTRTAAAAFFLLGPLASILCILLLWPLDVLGVSWVRDFLFTPDMGSSSSSLLCWGVFLAGERGRLRDAFFAGTLLTLVVLMALGSQAFLVDHLVAFIFGAGAAWVATVRRRAQAVADRR